MTKDNERLPTIDAPSPQDAASAEVSHAVSTDVSPGVSRVRVGLLELLLVFTRLGVTTFGGGVQGWIHREIVERRGWIDDKVFLSGMTLAQVLPGVNPVNLALYVGLRLRGGAGAAVAILGMVVPAFCVILILGQLYRGYGHLDVVHFVLGGLAAAGVGTTLTMGIRVARRLPRNAAAGAVAVVVFLLAGVLRWPMAAVVLVAVPFSVAWAFIVEKRNSHVG